MLGFSGAFGSFEVPLGIRLFYWIFLILSGNFIAFGTSKILDNFLDSQDNKISYHILFLCILTILTTIDVWLVSHFTYKLPLNRLSFLQFVLPVFLISVFMTLIFSFIDKIPLQSHEHKEQKIATIKFRERLPKKFQNAEIFAISAEDHYLRIYTSIGETMILMRLYDAIKELDGIEGSQTHRSWWVNKNAVKEIIKGDGKLALFLENEIQAPISRSYQKTLREQGWL